MEKFKLHTVEDDGELYHCVYETQSNQLINYFFFEDDAREELTKLKSGIGFDGFTPAFMLNTSYRKAIESKNINSKFATLTSK